MFKRFSSAVFVFALSGLLGACGPDQQAPEVRSNNCTLVNSQYLYVLENGLVQRLDAHELLISSGLTPPKRILSGIAQLLKDSRAEISDCLTLSDEISPELVEELVAFQLTLDDVLYELNGILKNSDTITIQELESLKAQIRSRSLPIDQI